MRRALLLAALATPALPAAAQPLVPADTVRASGPARAVQADHRRPTWGVAARGAVLTTALAAGGAALGVGVGTLVAACPGEPSFCRLDEQAWGGVAGLAAGSLGGAVLARRGAGRGSVLGVAAGSVGGLALGVSAGEALARERCTTAGSPGGPQITTCDTRASGALVGVLATAAALAGGTVGFRYGPGARGPGRAARVALVPVASPRGGGVYALVRF